MRRWVVASAPAEPSRIVVASTHLTTRRRLRESVAMDTDVWRQRIRDFSEEREWGHFHDPKNLAMALSVEVGRARRDLPVADARGGPRGDEGDRRQDVADEVADVMTYLLRLVDVLELDLEAAMASKAERNAARYPVATSRGSSAKAPSLAGARPARPEPIEVTMPVLGVDGCKAGWVGAVLEPGAPRPRVVVAPTIAELVSMVRESLGIVVVGIDIPIGLPDNTIRQADVLARKALPGKASSIFSTLTRAGVCRRLPARGRRGQPWARRPGRRSAGLRAARQDPRGRCMAAHAPDGDRARGAPRGVLRGHGGRPDPREQEDRRGPQRAARRPAAAGIPRPSVLEGQGYAADDVIDACAVAWSAARHTLGLAQPLPDPPERFSDGIAAAIWA